MVLCIYCAINLDDCRFVLISVNIRFTIYLKLSVKIS